MLLQIQDLILEVRIKIVKRDGSLPVIIEYNNILNKCLCKIVAFIVILKSKQLFKMLYFKGHCKKSCLC